jgi:hypothetical protein
LIEGGLPQKLARRENLSAVAAATILRTSEQEGLPRRHGVKIAEADYDARGEGHKKGDE